MTIGLLASVALLGQGVLGGATQSVDSVRLCLRDAVTGGPVVGVTIRDASGAQHVAAGDCVRVPRGANDLLLARVGYRPRTIAVGAASRGDTASIFVVLVPRLGAGSSAATNARDVTTLATQRVTATAVARPAPGAVQASVTMRDARERGVSTLNGVIALLPYTSLRSARGESGLSLRGARREQVVITLDGLPLNDPATGVADVNDVPLAALQSITVRPGADPLGAGSGASGGVLALTSASQRLLSVRSGAFGQWTAEAAWAGSSQRLRWNGSMSHRRAQNDFAFVNDAGEHPVREQRTNNDEQRSVFSLGLVSRQTQWSVLVSAGERGMVGPANVRAYDEDRSRTMRALLRGQVALGATLLTTGIRRFTLGYRDPQQPELDTRAAVWASDLEWRGSVRHGEWRVGAGTDALTATSNVSQQRSRAFAAWGWRRSADTASRLDLDAGVRADAVERHGVQPTGSAGLALRVLGGAHASSLSVLARGAQAVRVPTLYDLYFGSPQRLSVRALAPERVTLDASVGLRGGHERGTANLTGEVLLVARDTKDAIVWFPGNFGWSPANVGRERLRGTEARLEYNSPALTLGAWHTWYRATLRTGLLSIPTPYVPQHSAGMQAAWRHGANSVSTNVRLQGRRPYTAGPRNPLFELPAVALTDVAWSRQHTVANTRALISLSLDNVTNVRWQSVRGFPMPGRGWSAALTLQPRS
jgi:outer membrane cobalamin receptor